MDAVVPPDALETGPVPYCAKCGDCVGPREWLPPFKVELALWRGDFTDLATMAGRDLLVSEHFSRVYKDAGLTGLRGFDPVEIVKVKRRRRASRSSPKYLHVRPARSLAAFDAAASDCEWDHAPTCDLCRTGSRKRWKRVILEPGSWCGEDIFIPRGLNEVMVSSLFKDVCDANMLKTPPLVDAKAYHFDGYPWERKDWDLRLFDETVAVLRSHNSAGQLDEILRAVEDLRSDVIAKPRPSWILDLRDRLGERIAVVGEAASEAYANLCQNP